MAFIPSSMEKLTPDVLERKRRERLAKLAQSTAPDSPTPILGIPFAGSKQSQASAPAAQPSIMPSTSPIKPVSPVTPPVPMIAPAPLKQGAGEQYPLSGLVNPEKPFRPNSNPDLIRNQVPNEVPSTLKLIRYANPLNTVKLQAGFGKEGAGGGLVNPNLPMGHKDAKGNYEPNLPSVEKGTRLSPSYVPPNATGAAPAVASPVPVVNPNAPTELSSINDNENEPIATRRAKFMRPGQFYASGPASTMSGQVDTGLLLAKEGDQTTITLPDGTKRTRSWGKAGEPVQLSDGSYPRISAGSDLSAVPRVGGQSFAPNTPYKGRMIPAVQPKYRGDTSMSDSVASRQKAAADRDSANQQQLGLIRAQQPALIEQRKLDAEREGRVFTGKENELTRQAEQKRTETQGKFAVDASAARPIADKQQNLGGMYKTLSERKADIELLPDDDPTKATKLKEVNAEIADVKGVMLGKTTPSQGYKGKTFTEAQAIEHAKLTGKTLTPEFLKKLKDAGYIVG